MWELWKQVQKSEVKHQQNTTRSLVDTLRLIRLHYCFHKNLISAVMSVPWSFLRWKRGEPRKLFLMELRRVLHGMPPIDGLGGGVGVGVPDGLSLGVCTGVPFGVGSGLPRGEG